MGRLYPSSIDADDRAVSHLCYEVCSLGELPRWISYYDRGNGPLILKQACLEAFLVHARLLIEFLVGRRTRTGGRTRKASDIAPTDFVQTWEPVVPENFDPWLDLADKHLSHLSRARSSQLDGVDWNTIEIAGSILDLFDSFVDQADRENASLVGVLRINAARARKSLARPVG